MPALTEHLRCSADELRLLSPVEELDDLRRHAVTTWLRRHDLTPAMVSVGMPIRRNPDINTVEWHEPAPGSADVRRWRLVPTSGATWPEPFPSILVGQ